MDRLMKRELPTLTKKGREWLKAAIDPFHDTVETVQGFPDPQGGYSIQLCVKRSITVTKPKLLPPGATWDAHICLTGLLLDTPIQTATCQTVSGLTIPSVQTRTDLIDPANTIGTVTVVTEVTGQPTMPSFVTPFNPTSPTLAMRSVSPVRIDPLTGQAVDGFLGGRARLNFAGFEVVNTTAPLYASGAVTAYNQLGAPDKQMFQDYGEATPYWVQSAPPANHKEAMLLQGARQWRAAEGCYVVGQFAGVQLPATQPEGAGFLWLGGDVDPGTQGAPGVYNYGVVLKDDFGVPTAVCPTFVKTAPILGHGAYFTGLSEQTVLTLNARFGIEMFPTEKDPIAMLASSMSPYYDPASLEAYQRIIFDMPPGVPLSENFTGEWFGKAVKAIGTYGPTALRAVATLVPDPRVKALAAGGAALIEGVNKMSVSAKEKKRAREEIVQTEEKIMRDSTRKPKRAFRAGGMSRNKARR
jgi:hypothetical protein